MTGPRAREADNLGFSSAQRDKALRNWEAAKLIAILPVEGMLQALNLSHAEFKGRDPQLLAAFLMSKTANLTAPTIAQGRLSLLRLIRHLFDTDGAWDGAFGSLPEINLFDFLMGVHTSAVAKAPKGKSGAEAVWGVFRGLSMLQPRFNLQLPLQAVKTCLPIAGAPRGQGLALTGAKPLPPEVLPLLSAYICDKSAPPVLRSWALALTFSAVSSLRQANAQHIAFYGTFSAKIFSCHNTKVGSPRAKWRPSS